MQQSSAKNVGFLTQENESPRLWLLIRNEPAEGVYAYKVNPGLSRSKVNFIDPWGWDAGVPGGGIGPGGTAEYGLPAGTDIYTGEASYYPPSGYPTANGERYDPNGFTAAMQKNLIPNFNTIVYVNYNDQKGRACTIKVRVNDRGPYSRDENGKWIPHPTRIIDLTPAAFDQLVGTLRPGVVPVEVIIP